MRKIIQERTLRIYTSLYNVLDFGHSDKLMQINMNVRIWPMRCNRKPRRKYWPAIKNDGEDLEKVEFICRILRKKSIKVWFPEIRIDLWYLFFFLLFSGFLFSLTTCQVMRGGGVATHPQKNKKMNTCNHSLVIAK